MYTATESKSKDKASLQFNANTFPVKMCRSATITLSLLPHLKGTTLHTHVKEASAHLHVSTHERVELCPLHQGASLEFSHVHTQLHAHGMALQQRTNCPSNFDNLSNSLEFTHAQARTRLLQSGPPKPSKQSQLPRLQTPRPEQKLRSEQESRGWMVLDRQVLQHWAGAIGTSPRAVLLSNTDVHQASRME